MEVLYLARIEGCPDLGIFTDFEAANEAADEYRKVRPGAVITIIPVVPNRLTNTTKWRVWL